VALYSITLLGFPIFSSYNEYYEYFDHIILVPKLFIYGLIELTLIIVSLIYLQILRKRESIIFGILGTTFLLIEFFIHFSSYFFDSQFSIGMGFITFFISISLIFMINIIFLLLNESKIENFDVKSLVLDLGTKYDRLEVKEISQKSKIDGISIVYILKDMIKSQEINAEYFSSSRAIVFDQRANLREIDNLIGKFTYSKDKKVEDLKIPMDSEVGE
jgi:hypothetical protein